RCRSLLLLLSTHRLGLSRPRPRHHQPAARDQHGQAKYHATDIRRAPPRLHHDQLLRSDTFQGAVDYNQEEPKEGIGFSGLELANQVKWVRLTSRSQPGKPLLRTVQ